ncbi:MAG: hypothetical protein C3F07_05505 [Anaerolineales bacterium]|nr:hypothetical protein [Anaerolineae bacterium]PWB75786.1 MAG: hypothetical protein C3F07_05505 [Anaerolineales bacterium]
MSLSWIIILLVAITSVGLLMARDWRWLIILLSAQYVTVFILTLQNWPLGMASVKVVTGWMGATILGMTRSGLPDEADDGEIKLPQGRLFHLFAAGIVASIVAAVTPRVDTMMADAGSMVTAGSLLLIGMGLLHLALTDQVLRVALGLMTLLSGFEVLYSAVESSVLVAALLAVINLGLALVGAYLLLASNAKETDAS